MMMTVPRCRGELDTSKMSSGDKHYVEKKTNKHKELQSFFYIIILHHEKKIYFIDIFEKKKSYSTQKK